jgi:peptidoglycan/xylan/chitin deacetylase (PgdA/CDA1 family)
MPGLRVLAFHRVIDEPKSYWDISWRSFVALLDDLQATGLPVDAELGDADPARALGALTFDDGTTDHLAVGQELASRGLQGLFFVTSSRVGADGYLDVKQLTRLRDLGHIVGSHAEHHERLEPMSTAQVAREVESSKRALEEMLGIQVRYFAAPGGSSHSGLREQLELNGYLAARSMRWGVHRSRADRWEIPCLPVTAPTVRYGWIATAVATGRLPAGMRALGASKALLPARLKQVLRRATGRSH